MTIDWDKSGVFSQSSRVALGPSLGFVDIQGAVIDITAAGSYAIPFGAQLIKISVAGAVVLNLPSAKAPKAGAMALPNQSAITPITITDTGGFAQANPITINPIAGETISGLSTIQLATNYASITLRPSIDAGLWSALG